MRSSTEALVIGAGPAGLATSAALSRLGVAHAVLERGARVGETWAGLYDGLVLHTAKRLSALPGLAFPGSTPRFPTRDDFVAYLERYAVTFRVPVETRADVASLRRDDGAWVARTTAGADVQARAVVVATGIVANPHVPAFPGRASYGGRVMHSVEYRRPDAFVGQRVLVVGAGNSAGEIAAELARAGARVTVAVRTGAVVVPREIAGIPIQYFSLIVGALPRGAGRATAALMARLSALLRGPAVLPAPPPTNCPHVPIIGFHLVDAIRSGQIQVRGGLEAFTPSGVRFSDGSEADFDTVLLATGYRAAVGLARGLIELDACGFARRRNRVASFDQPDLYFVGHNYSIQGGLFNIGRDAALAARQIGNRHRESVS
jgi:putative flavoprotein involved in K+ transport